MPEKYTMAISCKRSGQELTQGSRGGGTGVAQGGGRKRVNTEKIKKTLAREISLDKSNSSMYISGRKNAKERLI